MSPLDPEEFSAGHREQEPEDGDEPHQRWTDEPGAEAATETDDSVDPEAARLEPLPQIYIASLSDYNAGRLYGLWIPAGIGAEAIHAAIQQMLGASREPGAEEWAIHDYEGFGPVHLSEYTSIDVVGSLAEGIIEHGEAFGHWAAYLGSSAWDDQLDRFEDNYLGHYGSRTEFASEYLEMSGIDPEEIGPEELRPYIRIDLEAYARDLAYSYRVVENSGGEVYVFGLE